MTNAIEELIRAARDVVNKWDSPAWGGRYLEHTAEYINQLRQALAAVEQQATQPAQNVVERLRGLLSLTPDSYKEIAHSYTPGLAKCIEEIAATQPCLSKNAKNDAQSGLSIEGDGQATQPTVTREYPYAIGDRVIEKHYPAESKNGGLIEFVDCGELHSLLANFYNALIAAGLLKVRG